ncbi:hypothetical protein GLW05_06530 [Pontibacillus yanchengensis]|uniref:Uncharacterized protein n=1 Tax=Pontibacillus yanchengensis TaxID=462910 RepID=A0A6I4ZSP1_9BACI|nr:hypothetical protein [Pontibacillus yanchengensis]MYL33255.1 hypothetical protein [Pontibacillus yanchengensis]
MNLPVIKITTGNGQNINFISADLMLDIVWTNVYYELDIRGSKNGNILLDNIKNNNNKVIVEVDLEDNNIIKIYPEIKSDPKVNSSGLSMILHGTHKIETLENNGKLKFDEYY